MKLVDDWREAKKWGSMQLGAAGTLLFALGSGLTASGSAVAWINVIPRWAVFALASVICAAIMAARILHKEPRSDHDEYGI